jgi:hypothetical protein
LDKAKGGNAAARKSFKHLGMSWQDLSRLSPEERLRAVLAGIQKLPPKMRALGGALLGKSFQKFGPMMQDGALGIDAQMAMAKKYGAFIGSDGKTSIEDFERSQLEMQYAMMGLQVTLATKVGPALTKIVDLTSKLFGWFGKLPGPIQTVGLVAAMALGPVVVILGSMASAVLKLIKLYRTLAATEALAGAAGKGGAFAGARGLLGGAGAGFLGVGLGSAALAGAAGGAAGWYGASYADKHSSKFHGAATWVRHHGPIGWTRDALGKNHAAPPQLGPAGPGGPNALRGLSARDIDRIANRPIKVQINGRTVAHAVGDQVRDKKARK